MPVLAQDLIEGRPSPITVQADTAVRTALELMLENEFSQLPVVDSYSRPLGLMSSDSILRGMANLRLPVEKLQVAHVTDKVDRLYPVDYPIFDLLRGLNASPALLIVDNDGCLIGIITNWDTAQYFRRRAADMMMLADIEELLKAHIRAAFTTPQTGKLNESLLQAAINEITNTGEQRFKDIRGGLKRYLSLVSLEHTPKEEPIEEAFAKIISRSTHAKTLDDLTFYEFTELLLHKSVWSSYEKYLNIPAENLRQMLDEVRTSRNDLAHFKRDELTSWERGRVNYCVRFLQEIRPPMAVETVPEAEAPNDDIIPIAEEMMPTDSMYLPLALYLQALKEERRRLTFQEIEAILGKELPDSAREHRSWWANDSTSHVQSQQWLDAGWRISYVNMSEGAVTFARIIEREKSYIDFFSSLLTQLRTQAPFTVRDASPMGVSWMNVLLLPRNGGGQVGSLTFSFARGDRFRVEFYFDTGNQRKNKNVFDKLFKQKAEIETALGETLSWERLDSRRASRIALYHPGSIYNGEEQLAQLQAWAVNAMIRFEQAIAEKGEKALKAVMP